MSARSDLLTPAEAAEYLRASVPTLARWRVQGYGPVYIKRGARVFYRPTDLDNFIDNAIRKRTRIERVSFEERFDNDEGKSNHLR